MDLTEVFQNFQDDVVNNIYIKRDTNIKDKIQFRIHHPFYFDDGDHLGLLLKQIDGKWVISDGGHFFFHLGIFMDDEVIHSGKCKEWIDRCRRMFDIEDREGELISVVENDKFADSLFDFLQFFMRAMHVEIVGEEEQRQFNMKGIEDNE